MAHQGEQEGRNEVTNLTITRLPHRTGQQGPVRGRFCLTPIQYFNNSRNMESNQALLAFAALSQSTRLDVFRLLMAAEPKGMSAGDLAKQLAVPANTLSAHLNVMARANLVRGERQSRTIIYRAQIDDLRALIGFLLEDCCGGRPEICTPIIEHMSCCTKASCT